VSEAVRALRIAISRGKDLVALAVVATLFGALLLYAEGRSSRQARLEAACGSIRTSMRRSEVLRRLGPPQVKLASGEVSRAEVATLWHARPKSGTTCWYWYSDPSLLGADYGNVVEVCFDQERSVAMASCWRSPLWEP